MNHYPNHHREQLTSHLEARDWTERDITPLLRMIATTALTSDQGALRILEYQQAIDERIEAEKQHDEVFIQPPLFDEAPHLEVTDISQEFFNRHWK